MKYGHFIVGLCGRSGSGKTPLRRLITEHFKFLHKDVHVTWRSFAEPIKEALRCVGVEKGHPLYRDMAQHIGQRFREADPDFWVNIAMHAISGLSKRGVVILDDVRHQNEADQCDLVVRVHSDNPSELTASQMMHVSERSWESILPNVVAYNTHPGQLEEAVDLIVPKILEGVGK